MADAIEEITPKILFVDDEVAILRSIKRGLRKEAWDLNFATSGEAALDLMETNEFAVVVSDMKMPGISGAEFLSKVRERQPLAVRVLLSGYADINDVRSVVNEAGIFNYLPKPWSPDSLIEVVGSAIRQYTVDKTEESDNKKLKKKSLTLGKIALLMDRKAKEREIEVSQAMILVEGMHAQMQSRFKDSVKVLNQIIDWKEGRDTNHTKFVMKYSEMIAEKLELDDIDDIITAATLHRVGMVGMPDKLSEVPYYRLSKEEKAVYDSYPILSEAALTHAVSLKAASKIIRHQREYINGTGLPDGLHTDQIPPGSQIICLLSDFYDVVTGKMEKNISGVESAIEYIDRWVDKKYAALMCNVFKEVLDVNCELLSGSVLISSAALKEGMTLDQGVNTAAGAVLVSNGTVLTQVIIDKIIEFEEPGSEYLVSNGELNEQQE